MDYAVLVRLARALRDTLVDLGDLHPGVRIRTLHHLSRTGGTVISKCIAAMPNVILLSEINPLSMGRVLFNPRDPLQVFFARYGGLTEDELRRAFLLRLHPVVRHCADNGLVLVLRDHSHADFLEEEIRETNSLFAFTASHYDIVPLVTVRNPIDSYLSMIKAGFTGGTSSFDDYCSRVMRFAERYASAPHFRYEDFSINPDTTLLAICKHYEILFDERYRETFSSIRLTGDSGALSGVIAPRPRQDVSDALRQEIEDSVHFKAVAQRFGYAGLD